MGEYNPEHADPIEIPDALNTDALAAFLETHTEYRIWYNADGDPLLVELGGSDEQIPHPADAFDVSREDIIADNPLDLPPEPEPRRRCRDAE